jgi:penicillin-binding protein 1A
MLRLLGYFFGIGAVLFLLVAGGVIIYVGDLTKDLPDYEVLARYEPPVTTRIHSADGQLMGEFATERRLFIPIQAVPDRVKAAFLSAEDKNFYTHPGVDFMALARAVVTNVQNYQSGRRMVGASTITQQVAKNFLLTNDRTIDRKIREAVLSFRIEQAYSKDRILELYLNEIFFGAGAYGIAGAALTYFGKSVNELNLQEAAYLAALPKAPNNYHPFDDTDAAISRRNWIIDRMVENGYATADEAQCCQGTAARRQLPPLRRLRFRLAIFHRGSAQADRRTLRQGRALRGRPVGARNARSAFTGSRPQGAAARPDPVRPPA